MRDTMGIIVTNDDQISPITEKRAVSALPIAGRYRIIDFVLSGMTNAGITNVGVVTKSNYLSLMDHIKSGKPWDLDRKKQGLNILPPNLAKAYYGALSGNIDMLHGVRDYIRKSDQTYVILSMGDYIYNIDFDDICKKHVESQADVTIVYKDMTGCEEKELSRFTLLDMDDAGRVTDIEVKPYYPKTYYAGMDIYIMEKALLESIIDECSARGEEVMIEIQGLKKKFGKFYAVDDINITLENGIYGLLGPNGAGKTTLLRVLTGLYKANAGNITMDNQYSNKDKEYYKTIGYLPQKFELFKELSVYDAMEYFCSIKSVDKKAVDKEIRDCIAKVNLTEKINSKVGKLSGGMLRRLGIAQSLINNPKILIFDEPTTGLDPEERLRFKSIVNTISRDRVIIISTHIVDDIEAVCDKVLVMSKGKILCNLTCEELKACANDKIYELDKINESHKMISCSEKEGKIIYRVASKEKLDALSVAPKLEDGYICMLNDI